MHKACFVVSLCACLVALGCYDSGGYDAPDCRRFVNESGVLVTVRHTWAHLQGSGLEDIVLLPGETKRFRYECDDTEYWFFTDPWGKAVAHEVSNTETVFTDTSY